VVVVDEARHDNFAAGVDLGGVSDCGSPDGLIVLLDQHVAFDEFSE
jgi:hypothetical protein